MPFLLLIPFFILISNVFAEEKQDFLNICQQELKLRDSIIIVNDSIHRSKESFYKSELLLEKEKVDNWESSFNLMKDEYQKCSMALSQADFTEEENVSTVSSDSLSKEDNSSSAKTKVLIGASFLGGVAIGAFLFNLFF